MADEIKAKVAEIQKQKGGGQKQIDVEEFEWIQLNKELAQKRDADKAETASDKFKRKFKENPLIPIGCGLTAFCLMSGLFKFARKDSAGSQFMMRGRIAAQGFTIGAMIMGVFIQFKKHVEKTKES